MKTSRFVLAALAYIVVTFVLAVGWHLGLFKGVYDELGIFTRREPLIPLGVLSMVVQGAVLAYAYPFFSRGGSPVREGLRFGLVMGAFIASSAVLATAGKHEVSSLRTWLVLESAFYALQYAIVGPVIALVYGDTAPPGR